MANGDATKAKAEKEKIDKLIKQFFDSPELKDYPAMVGIRMEEGVIIANKEKTCVVCMVEDFVRIIWIKKIKHLAERVLNNAKEPKSPSRLTH